MSPIVFSLAIIVCVSAAQPLRNEMASEELYPGFPHESAYEEAKQMRNLDSIGGGNLLRDLQNGLLRSRGYMLPRQNREYLDSISGTTFGTSKRFSGPVFPADKRNGMDEIDRVGFNTFIKKKNFDEIDRSGFDGFVKRNFDEIDRAGFNGFVKRSSE
uniref:Orcokinin A n=1 Tax=Plautia stali TaxID=106108 RepID=A0A1I9FZH3_PLAST|nr:orcokinin A [Plautia stali]